MSGVEGAFFNMHLSHRGIRSLVLIIIFGLALVAGIFMIQVQRDWQVEQKFGASALNAVFVALGTPRADLFFKNVSEYSTGAGMSGISIPGLSTITTLAIAGVALVFLVYSILSDRGRTGRVQRDKDDLTRAAHQSGRYVFSYDIVHDTAHRFFDSKEVFGIELGGKNYYSKRVYMQIIMPESRGAYDAFMERIRRGEPTGETEFLIRLTGGRTVWFYADYMLVNDKAGKPKRAIITLCDDSEGRERALAYEKWRQQMKRTLNGVTLSVEANLTRDLIERAEGEHCAQDAQPGTTLSAFLRCVLNQIVIHEDILVFAEFFRRERLMALFYGGVGDDTLEFRARGDGADYLYYRAEVSMVRYPRQEEINLFATFTNIDAEKRAREELEEMATRDSLTHLLNRTTLKARIDKALFEAKPDDTCAMLMIDLDNFKLVNDTAGHQQGDRTLCEVARAIFAQFRDDDAVGRIGGDEFIAFINGRITRATAVRKATALCEAIAFDIGGIHVSATVGAVVSPCAQTSFEELYRVSDMALYRTKRRRKGGFRVEVVGENVGMEAQPAVQDDETFVTDVLCTRYQAIIDQLADGTLLMEIRESEIKLFHVSPPYYDKLCLDDAPMGGMPPLSAFVRAADLVRVTRAILACAREGGVMNEIYRTPAESGPGALRRMRATRIPYEDADAPVVLAVITDIPDVQAATPTREELMAAVSEIPGL